MLALKCIPIQINRTSNSQSAIFFVVCNINVTCEMVPKRASASCRSGSRTNSLILRMCTTFDSATFTRSSAPYKDHIQISRLTSKSITLSFTRLIGGTATVASMFVSICNFHSAFLCFFTQSIEPPKERERASIRAMAEKCLRRAYFEFIAK